MSAIVIACCGGGGTGGGSGKSRVSGDPWDVSHPGKDSYSSLDEMAKDFDAVYLIDPKKLELSDQLNELVMGISKGGEYVTIFCRLLLKYQKFTKQFICELRGRTDGDPGVRYIIDSFRWPRQPGKRRYRPRSKPTPRDCDPSVRGIGQQ